MKLDVQEIKRIVTLAWPLLIAQLTQTLMGVSDTIMAGHFSSSDMAAVAIGFSITMPVLFFLQGLILALPPTISHLNGARQYEKVANSTQQLTWLVLGLSLAISVGSFQVPMLFEWAGMDPSLRDITSQYVQAVLVASPAFVGYQILRNFCESLAITKPSMTIMVFGLLINIPANYVLIYGKLGFPAMGGVGCGIATALVFLCMFLATLLYVKREAKLKKYALFARVYAPQYNAIKSHFTLGFPIALTILFEVTLFAVVAILLSPLGADVVASHQIALNFSSIMFMFPLSIGMATTIRVGFLLGEQNGHEAGNAAFNAIVVGLSVAFFTAMLTITMSTSIPLLYTSDQAVIEMAASLMVLAAMFQLSDAIQVISAGALRGYKDTTAMSVITFTAYWLIGLPIGCTLALTDWVTAEPMFASGFWIGFICGLTSAAVMLGYRLKKTHTQFLSHLQER